MKKIIVATKNNHKTKEINEILKDLDFEVISRADYGVPDIEIVEDKDTFEGNSEKKAFEIMKMTGEIALADDSGLMVDFLDGAPGVYSARFAGEDASDQDNNDKLLNLLKNVEIEDRKAKFVSVVSLCFPNGETLIARGECRGHIIFEARGDNGFGYDPLFIPDGFEKTYAELSSEDKNKISHRSRALAKLKEILKSR